MIFLCFNYLNILLLRKKFEMSPVDNLVKPQFWEQVSSIQKVLSEQKLTQTFKKYTPSEKKVYAFDNSHLITIIKEHVIIKDNHSDASFNVTCLLVKKILNSK